MDRRLFLKLTGFSTLFAMFGWVGKVFAWFKPKKYYFEYTIEKELVYDPPEGFSSIQHCIEGDVLGIAVDTGTGTMYHSKNVILI